MWLVAPLSMYQEGSSRRSRDGANEAEEMDAFDKPLKVFLLVKMNAPKLSEW